LKEIKYNIVTNRPSISCERCKCDVNVKRNIYKTNEENHNEKNPFPSISNGEFIWIPICSLIAYYLNYALIELCFYKLKLKLLKLYIFILRLNTSLKFNENVRKYSNSI